MPLMDKCLLFVSNLKLTAPIMGITSMRNYAARKGTRAKRAKSKVKKEVTKVAFIPHNQRNLESMLASRPKLRFDDSWKQKPLDNVYSQRYYQWPTHPFDDAVRYLQEIHHPEMFNRPKATVHVIIELNMEGEKKTKFLDNFHRIVAMPHPFEHGDERTLIAFAKDEAKQQAAREAGASLVGGVELIKDVQNGALSISDFQFIVAEPSILPELLILRGIMKRKFPNPRLGTLDDDVAQMVRRLVNGINYHAKGDEYEKDFGSIQSVLGTLNMNPKHLEGNFEALVKDVMEVKPKREGDFITRCLLWCPPYGEKLRVDHNVYLEDQQPKSNNYNDAEENNEQHLHEIAS